MVFNPRLFGFVVAGLFFLGMLSIGFLSWLALSHKAPSIISVVAEWLTSARGHPAFSPVGQVGCQ